MSGTITHKDMVPVARPFVGKEEEEAVLQVLRSGWLSQGKRVEEFERRFAQYVGAEHAIAVSSCTTALHLGMIAAGIRQGDEVLCPSLSFIATANSIVYQGAKPVFVDIDPRTYNLDPNRIEDAITPRTKAILVVHQIGMPAALTEILEIAQRHNLSVIEDAACAIGSEYRGNLISGRNSLLACFSFHPRKILTTGEGGMITTSNHEAARRLRRLRQHAMSISDMARHGSKEVMIETYDELGYNYRMTDLQAAVGLVQLDRMSEFLERRRYLAARYTEKLADIPCLVTPFQPTYARSNFQSYMVRLTGNTSSRRDSLMQSLLERGISTRRGIMASHREPPYRDARWDRQLSATNAAADECMVLPLFHQMAEPEQDFVVESIREVTSGLAVAPLNPKGLSGSSGDISQI
jgi:perosamine synthetase